jgi:hypothetical protein
MTMDRAVDSQQRTLSIAISVDTFLGLFLPKAEIDATDIPPRLIRLAWRSLSAGMKLYAV